MSDKPTQQNAKIGLISRIDAASDGFRKGLLDAIFHILREEEGTHFNILVGGLVGKKSLSEKVKAYVSGMVRKDKILKRKYPRFADLLPSERLPARKKELAEHFITRVAKELASIIPTITIPDPEDPAKKKVVDLFITTSPAFDGELGEIVAHSLADLRPDVRVWKAGGDRFPVKHVDKLIWALAPQKAVWMRGDFYSTPVERVIKDKIKQTPQGPPDIFVVGGFASAINKPKGELPYRYVSIPAACRLEETRVSENQIGLSVLEYQAGENTPLFRNYNLKDLVSKELSFITPPSGATSVQKRIIEIMQSRGWVTPGILKYHLNITPEEIQNEMRGLMKKKASKKNGQNWPGVTEGSGKKYYFDLDWIQKRLKYFIENGPWNEDIIVSFACVHAGSVETDYEFFVNELPQIILKKGATILVDAGDTKEGLKHGLMMKGEVIAGMNSTQQEKFAAHLIGTVIFKVFTKRFDELIANLEKNKLSLKKIKEMVLSALLWFYYILGNHDLWETEDGHEPLEVFKAHLVRFLTDKIEKHLASHGLPYIPILELVESRIQLKEIFELPSGLKVSIQHPHMSRAKTTSIRPQEMLNYAKSLGCQVAIGGNFHVSEHVDEWDMELGQCVVQEIGTIKHGSNFERHKMKTVDQGVGYLKIRSKDKRIFMTESAFYGAPRARLPVENIDVINDFIEKLGIPPIKRS